MHGSWEGGAISPSHPRKTGRLVPLSRDFKASIVYCGLGKPGGSKPWLRNLSPQTLSFLFKASWWRCFWDQLAFLIFSFFLFGYFASFHFLSLLARTPVHFWGLGKGEALVPGVCLKSLPSFKAASGYCNVPVAPTKDSSCWGSVSG